MPLVSTTARATQCTFGVRSIDGDVILHRRSRFAAARPRNTHEEALLAAFDSNRARIFEVATRIYGHGSLGISYDLTPADF